MKKLRKITLIAAGILLFAVLGMAQKNLVQEFFGCNYDTDDFEGRMVAGDFDQDGFVNDVAMISDRGTGLFAIEVVKAYNSIPSSSVWYSNYSINLSVYPYIFPDQFPLLETELMNGRMVSGDFNQDGYIDDIAIFYEATPTRTEMHIFNSALGDKFVYGGIRWVGPSYRAEAITDRIVSGDFDSDGRHDDIAMFYDYSPGNTKLHVLINGSGGFAWQGSDGWWDVQGSYTADKISGRVVSGDFDRDNRHDDIAAFYDYNGETRIHVWLGDGNHFDYQWSNGWWIGPSYTAERLTGRVVSGDFDRDGKNDDIAGFYDYGNGETRIHVWESKSQGVFGNAVGEFTYQGNQGWWSSGENSFTADRITGRVFSGNFDRDDNIFNDSDGKWDDILTFYDYGPDSERLIMFQNHQGDSFKSKYLNLCGKAKSSAIDPGDNQVTEEVALTRLTLEKGLEVSIGPNPSRGNFRIVANQSVEMMITVYDATGRVIFSNAGALLERGFEINIEDQPAGIYFIELKNQENRIVEKLMIL